LLRARYSSGLQGRRPVVGLIENYQSEIAACGKPDQVEES
jgi:hypothetical protein